MTKKQKELVELIEETTGIKYSGRNLTKYIDSNKPLMEKVMQERERERDAIMDDIEFGRNW